MNNKERQKWLKQIMLIKLARLELKAFNDSKESEANG